MGDKCPRSSPSFRYVNDSCGVSTVFTVHSCACRCFVPFVARHAALICVHNSALSFQVGLALSRGFRRAGFVAGLVVQAGIVRTWN